MLNKFARHNFCESHWTKRKKRKASLLFGPRTKSKLAYFLFSYYDAKIGAMSTSAAT